MKVLVLAVCVAVVAAWTPGARDDCNVVNINGGSSLLPHERFCQLFYSCDSEGNQRTLTCPNTLLFSYGTGIASCTGEGFNSFNCPKWQCSQTVDIGRRYPDVCCGKYWECTAINVFSPKICAPGTTYDLNLEQCTTQSNCLDSGYCLDNIRGSGNNECHNSPGSDPCTYRTDDWDQDRQCPVGTSFDVSTCACSQFNQGCSASGLSAEILLSNKNPDAQCRASGRVEWNNGGTLRVFSDKLNVAVDHYFYRAPGFTSNSQEAFFSTSNNAAPMIYDYYYNDNTLYAPLAIVMTVRFDINNNQLLINNQWNLLENRFTTDNSNTHCRTTLRISARYLGVNLGDRSWEFEVFAVGENGVESTGVATISGSSNDYFRVVFTFGVRVGNTIGIGGTVTNRGQSGQITNGSPISFVTDNRSMGGAIRPTKCGFAIGRNLNGALREFSVYEGCSSFAQLG